MLLATRISSDQLSGITNIIVIIQLQTTSADELYIYINMFLFSDKITFFRLFKSNNTYIYDFHKNHYYLFLTSFNVDINY